MAQDEKTPAEKAASLPGNHGQFGESNATEEFETLEDHAPSGDNGPKQTNAGERS